MNGSTANKTDDRDGNNSGCIWREEPMLTTTKTMRRVKPILIFLLILFVIPVYAQQSAAKPTAKPVPRSRDLGPAADGIIGLVINQTLTPNGNDFYKIFSILWSEKPESYNYSLSVQERLSKRYGNQISVYLGQKRVFIAVLPLKYDGLRPLGEKAVEEIQANMVALALEGNDIDIVRDEM